MEKWDFVGNLCTRQVQNIDKRKFSLPLGTQENSISVFKTKAKKLALNSPKIKKWLEGKEIAKTFYVKDKLLNLLTN